jgi:hypothetical protein
LRLRRTLWSAVPNSCCTLGGNWSLFLRDCGRGQVVILIWFLSNQILTQVRVVDNPGTSRFIFVRSWKRRIWHIFLIDYLRSLY